jgi:hypothetical protein
MSSRHPEPPDQFEFEVELRRIYKRRRGSITSLVNWFGGLGGKYASQVSRQLNELEPMLSYPFRFVLWLFYTFLIDPLAEEEVWQLVCEVRATWRGRQDLPSADDAARQIGEIASSQMRGKSYAELCVLHSQFYSALNDALQEAKQAKVTHVYRPAETENRKTA